MLIEITLPILGTYQVWLGAIFVSLGMFAMLSLMTAIHFDNKRGGN